jgi:hypothetical protein
MISITSFRQLTFIVPNFLIPNFNCFQGSYSNHFNGGIGEVRINKAFSLEKLKKLEQLGIDDCIVDDCFLVGLKLPRLKQFTMFEYIKRVRSEVKTKTDLLNVVEIFGKK